MGVISKNNSKLMAEEYIRTVYMYDAGDDIFINQTEPFKKLFLCAGYNFKKLNGCTIYDKYYATHAKTGLTFLVKNEAYICYNGYDRCYDIALSSRIEDMHNHELFSYKLYFEKGPAEFKIYSPNAKKVIDIHPSRPFFVSLNKFYHEEEKIVKDLADIECIYNLHDCDNSIDNGIIHDEDYILKVGDVSII